MDDILRKLSEAGRLLDCGGGPDAPLCGADGHEPSARLSFFNFVQPGLSRPFAADVRPLFLPSGGEASLATLREATGLFLVFGACPSQELSTLAHDPEAMVIVVDPDRGRVAEAARDLGDLGA